MLLEKIIFRKKCHRVNIIIHRGLEIKISEKLEKLRAKDADYCNESTKGD